MSEDFENKLRSKIGDSQAPVPEGLLDAVRAEMKRRGLKPGVPGEEYSARRGEANSPAKTLASGAAPAKTVASGAAPAAGAVAGSSEPHKQTSARIVIFRWLSAAAVIALGVFSAIWLGKDKHVGDKTLAIVQTDPAAASPATPGAISSLTPAATSPGAISSAQSSALALAQSSAITSSRSVESAHDMNTKPADTQKSAGPQEAQKAAGPQESQKSAGLQEAQKAAKPQKPQQQAGPQETAIDIEDYLRQNPEPEKRKTKILLAAYTSATGGSSASSPMVNSADLAFASALAMSKITLLNDFSPARSMLLYPFDPGSMKHYMPLRFGLNADVALNRNLSAAMGLSYSFLHSENDGGMVDYDQKLHYLGIPLGLNLTFWRNGNFSTYAYGGAEIQWLVKGKFKTEMTTTSLSEGKPQLSANAGLGVSYAFTRWGRFFIEPGASYYFDNGTEIKNIYKERKFDFLLNVGISFELFGK